MSYTDEQIEAAAQAVYEYSEATSLSWNEYQQVYPRGAEASRDLARAALEAVQPTEPLEDVVSIAGLKQFEAGLYSAGWMGSVVLDNGNVGVATDRGYSSANDAIRAAVKAATDGEG